MTDYYDGNWHGWSGGDCPVSDHTKVEALWVDPKGEFFKVVNFACHVAWLGKHKKKLGDPISAFRVIKPHELWVDVVSGLTSRTRQPGMVLFREVAE